MSYVTIALEEHANGMISRESLLQALDSSNLGHLASEPAWPKLQEHLHGYITGRFALQEHNTLKIALRQYLDRVIDFQAHATPKSLPELKSQADLVEADTREIIAKQQAAPLAGVVLTLHEGDESLCLELNKAGDLIASAHFPVQDDVLSVLEALVALVQDFNARQANTADQQLKALKAYLASDQGREALLLNLGLPVPEGGALAHTPEAHDALYGPESGFAKHLVRQAELANSAAPRATQRALEGHPDSVQAGDLLAGGILPCSGVLREIRAERDGLRYSFDPCESMPLNKLKEATVTYERPNRYFNTDEFLMHAVDVHGHEYYIRDIHLAKRVWEAQGWDSLKYPS